MTEHDKTVYIRGLNAVGGKSKLNPEDSLYKIIELIPPNTSVLDVGCADGTLAQYLQEKNCSVVGIECDPTLAAMAEKHCDEVLQIDLDLVDLSTQLQGKNFEVILFADVLEHLKNPYTTLQQAQQLIPKGGYILASIPNISHGAVRLSLLQGKFQYEKSGLLDNTHLRFFTRLSALGLFVDSGYDAEVIETTHRPILGGRSVPLLHREEFTKELLDFVESAEDSLILQFIIKATVSNQEQGETTDFEKLASSTYNPFKTKMGEEIIIRSQTVKKLQLDLSTTQSQLEKLQLNLVVSQNELEETQSELEQMRSKLSELEQMRHKLSEMKAHLESFQAKIHAMEMTSFWKARTAYKQIEDMFKSLPRMLGK